MSSASRTKHMKIVEKMAAKLQNNPGCEGVTIAFLGDSVTQGCFDIYRQSDGRVETFYDQQSSYQRGVFDFLSMLYPACPINIINAGISGDCAPRGLARLERDVLRHQPDLCVVCYGLNDCGTDPQSIDRYIGALRDIFAALNCAGVEIIFMTPNMMNTAISPHLSHPDFIAIAQSTAQKQNDGYFDAHMEAARALCRETGVALCDCYAIWKALHRSGVNTTELLANKINHPTPAMNRIFSYELVKTMLEA